MTRTSGVRYVSVDDVETQVFPWGKLAWLSEPRVTRTDYMTADVVTLELGKGHDRHNHPGCEEMLYVQDGEGNQTVEDDGKIIQQRIKPGDLVYIPPGEYHSTVTPEKHQRLFLQRINTLGRRHFSGVFLSVSCSPQ